MGWNEKASQTVEQRSKEDVNDYRYFPDPDLPILNLSDEFISQLQSALPELPAAKRKRFKEEYGLPDEDIQNLVNWKELTEYFEEVVSEIQAWVKAEHTNEDMLKLMKMAANWCLQDFSALLNASKINPNESRITQENFAELLKHIADGKISVTAGKKVFSEMFEHGGEPDHIIEDLGLTQISDTSEIESAIDSVIKSNEKAVLDYKAGQQKSFGFLVGMAMKELKGKGNPQLVNEILKKKLE
jgi:aspartyl-tRNA(Asn)/glutamyl-tRNA(Gln) amidotransferase subunit B